MTHLGGQRIAAQAPVRNPAFDVTAALVTGGIITEAGIARPPVGPALAELSGLAWPGPLHHGGWRPSASGGAADALAGYRPSLLDACPKPRPSGIARRMRNTFTAKGIKGARSTRALLSKRLDEVQVVDRTPGSEAASASGPRSSCAVQATQKNPRIVGYDEIDPARHWISIDAPWPGRC